jgi:hypothetical protein
MLMLRSNGDGHHSVAFLDDQRPRGVPEMWSLRVAQRGEAVGPRQLFEKRLDS